MRILTQVTCPCDGPAHPAAVALLVQVKSAVRDVRWTIDDAKLEHETGLLTLQLQGTADVPVSIDGIKDRLNAGVDVGRWEATEIE